MAEKIDVQLIGPKSISLPVRGPAFERPSKDIIEKMYAVSTATASAMMHKMGIRQTFIASPLPRTPGRKVVGPAVTLQFMPQREDIYQGGATQEQGERASALWSVFDSVTPGDVLCIQAWGNMYTGCVGEMLSTYFKGRGGLGMVVDGCVRDWPNIQKIDIGMWTKGFTPNYASQATYMPYAYDVPIAMDAVLVLPGDIIIADDDGVVCVPQQMAQVILDHTLSHEAWEVFSRIKLEEGGSIWKYYPLSEEGWKEYEAWKAQREGKA
jgi:regulator of RNase E activity RraA